MLAWFTVGATKGTHLFGPVLGRENPQFIVCLTLSRHGVNARSGV